MADDRRELERLLAKLDPATRDPAHVQQVINQAKKQLSTSGVTGAAATQANQTLNKASKLTACVAAAGTDASKLSNCQAQYGG